MESGTKEGLFSSWFGPKPKLGICVVAIAYAGFIPFVSQREKKEKVWSLRICPENAWFIGKGKGCIGLVLYVL